MMRRRTPHEEHENLERWLVSYADFITLLFAFFVVMYSISSVNEGKYRVLSETLDMAFSKGRGAEILSAKAKPVPIGIVDPSGGHSDLPIPAEIPPSSSHAPDDDGKQDATDDAAQLRRVAEQIERVLAPYLQEDLIELNRHDSWVEVEMKSGLLFPSGHSDLAPEAIPMLEKLAEIFKTVPNAIQVEGHTDNQPINTREFPSNWELSAARAASVVHQLMRNGILPNRMAAIAYGEYHPIGDNASENGRYRNRRVTVILQAPTRGRFHGAAADFNAQTRGSSVSVFPAE